MTFVICYNTYSTTDNISLGITIMDITYVLRHSTDICNVIIYLSTKHITLWDQFEFHQSSLALDVDSLLIVCDMEGLFFCHMKCKENDWGTAV